MAHRRTDKARQTECAGTSPSKITQKQLLVSVTEPQQYKTQCVAKMQKVSTLCFSRFSREAILVDDLRPMLPMYNTVPEPTQRSLRLENRFQLPVLSILEDTFEPVSLRCSCV